MNKMFRKPCRISPLLILTSVVLLMMNGCLTQTGVNDESAGESQSMDEEIKHADRSDEVSMEDVVPTEATVKEKETVVMDIKHYRSQSLIGMGRARCLIYERVDSSGSGYICPPRIHGFYPRWGRNYRIKVKKFTLNRYMADAPSRVYLLEEVLSYNPVEPGEEFTTKVLLERDHRSRDPRRFIDLQTEMGGKLFRDRAFRCRDTDVCKRLKKLYKPGQEMDVTLRYPDNIDDPLILIDVSRATY